MSHARSPAHAHGCCSSSGQRRGRPHRRLRSSALSHFAASHLTLLLLLLLPLLPLLSLLALPGQPVDVRGWCRPELRGAVVQRVEVMVREDDAFSLHLGLGTFDLARCALFVDFSGPGVG